MGVKGVWAEGPGSLARCGSDHEFALFGCASCWSGRRTAGVATVRFSERCGDVLLPSLFVSRVWHQCWDARPLRYSGWAFVKSEYVCATGRDFRRTSWLTLQGFSSGAIETPKAAHRAADRCAVSHNRNRSRDNRHSIVFGSSRTRAIRRTDHAWIGRYVGPIFEPLEQAHILERERQLGRVEHVEHDHIVAAVTQITQSMQDFFDIVKKIAQIATIPRRDQRSASCSSIVPTEDFFCGSWRSRISSIDCQCPADPAGRSTV